MTGTSSISNNSISFKDFLFRDKRNKTILQLVATVLIIQFIVFKYLYPYPSFIHADSFVYIETATFNSDISTYLVGYARFLRLFSSFTSSDTALVLLQYLLIQASMLSLLFTAFYLFKPSKSAQNISLCFVVLNPLFLFLANLISSDGLFLSLSIFWITLLLWIARKQTTVLLVLQSLILFIAFTVRYNALIYPFIAILFFVFINASTKYKLIGTLSSVLLCGLFILYTGNKFKALTGIWQYSPFSGWQLANNAMYAYRYVNKSERKQVPTNFEVLDNMIRTYFDSTRDTNKYPHEAELANTKYMWSPGLPLQKYMRLQFNNNTNVTHLKMWASMGKLYKDYGLYIIKQYPGTFIRYFIWPNANKYYSLPVEYLGQYNMGVDTIRTIAKEWFNYNSSIVTTRTDTFNVRILSFYPILSGIVNFVFLLGSICFYLLKGYNNEPRLSKALKLVILIWILNAAFTITASSAALRFQVFPLMLITLFSILIIDKLYFIAKSMDAENIAIKETGLNYNATI